MEREVGSGEMEVPLPVLPLACGLTPGKPAYLLERLLGFAICTLWYLYISCCKRPAWGTISAEQGKPRHP